MLQSVRGGLSAWVLDGRTTHWNIDIPGSWVGPYTLNDLGSYISSFCEPRPGVYRLIALDAAGAQKPAPLNRICGVDETGTLYIGRELKNFASDSGRAPVLVRMSVCTRAKKSSENLTPGERVVDP